LGNPCRAQLKLIVVTLTGFIAGLALYAAEDRLFDYGGLPEWARPTALIVWTLCAAHVAIRFVMILWKGGIKTARFTAGIPQWRRQAAYERPVIRRLLATDGVEREVLCYALYQDKDRFWVSFDIGNPRWLTRLRQDRLLDIDHAREGAAVWPHERPAWRQAQAP
jgi:hypothetical protein